MQIWGWGKMNKYTYQRFNKKFEKFFQKKTKLLGEIYLSEKEYEALIEIARNRVKTFIDSENFTRWDLVTSVALVHIGIKDYTEGNYWDRVCETLNLNLNALQRTNIGQLFLATLKKYGLFIYDNPNTKNNSYVNNILIHGLVPNNYIEDFFEFIYTFYEINLNRSISSSLTTDLKYLSSFISESLENKSDDVKVKTSESVRTYKLRKSTKLFIGLQDRKARLLIRRLVKLMDAKYWNGELPRDPKNRITQAFLRWSEKSPRFQTDIEVTATGRGRGQKQFTSPYLTFDFRAETFNLIVPPQKFKNDEFTGEIVLLINIDNKVSTYKLKAFGIIGGYRTEEKCINIPNESIFKRISIRISSGVSRQFNIAESNYIILDELGQRTNSVLNGTNYIITKPGVVVESESIIEKRYYLKYTFYYINVEADSIIFIDNLQISSSTSGITEGLKSKGLVKGVTATSEDGELLPVYAYHPNILYRVNNKNIEGVGIIINRKRYRIIDIEDKVNLKQFELKDGTSGIGLYFNLSGLLGEERDVVELSLDEPGSYRMRGTQKYILIPKFKYNFFEAPYVFKDKAVIEITNGQGLRPVNMKKIEHEIYGINLYPEKTYAKFETCISDKQYTLAFEIPYLRWRFENSEWKIGSEEELWYKDIGDELVVDLPYVGNITLILNNDPETKQEGVYRDGTYRFNIKKYAGYFIERGAKHQINIRFNDQTITIATILSRCIAKYANLLYDPINKTLRGSFVIAGRGKCVADIVYKNTGEKIAENVDIVDGKLNLKVDFKGGIHKVTLYSVEEDDFGFGSVRRPILSRDVDTTDPYDLTNKSLKIRSIKYRVFRERLYQEYLIENIINSEQLGVYYGDIFIIDSERKRLWKEVSPVKVIFTDIENMNKAVIKLKYDDEWSDFLYDTRRKELALDEDPSLPKKIAYTRYEFLSDDETEFTVEIRKRGN